MKALTIISVLYLLGGVPGVIELMLKSPIERALSAVYLACIALGVAGSFAAFKDRPNVFRHLMLWAIGIPSLVYASNEMSLLFPAFFHFPVTFGSSYSTGKFARFGIDVIPSVLFLLVWFVGKQAQTASQMNRAEANNNAS
jgi:hypothetical protein